MCAQCQQPVVRDAWLEYITLDVKRGQKDYDLNRVSTLQELVDDWVEKESKYPMFVHENRCPHRRNENMEPSVIESLGDHLFIALPRASDSGGPTVYAPVSINKTLKLTIPARNDTAAQQWVGYPVAIISIHGNNRAAHYTATVLEGNGWVHKNDEASFPLPKSLNPPLPHFAAPQNSIPLTATFLVYRKLNDGFHPFSNLAHPYVFSADAGNDQAIDPGPSQPASSSKTSTSSSKTSASSSSSKTPAPVPADATGKATKPKTPRQKEKRKASKLRKKERSRSPPVGQEDDSDDAPGGQSNPPPKLAHPREKFTWSTKPGNVLRREDRRSSREARMAFRLREKLAGIKDKQEATRVILEQYQQLLEDLKDCSPVDRLESILVWMCILTQHRIAPVLEDLAEVVNHEPTCRALDAWASDPLHFDHLEHPEALDLANGDHTTSSNRHVFYNRSWGMTVADAIANFTRYAEDFKADIAFSNTWLDHLATLDPKSKIRVQYVGESSRGSPQVRHDEDEAAALAGDLHTRLGNILPLFAKRTSPDLFTWKYLTRDIGDQSGSPWSAPQLRRQHMRLESLLILLGGLFTLNSSSGGLPTDSFDLDSMSPTTLAVEQEMKRRFPFRPPPIVDSDKCPKLAQMRKDLAAIQQAEFEILASRGSVILTRAAKEAIMASLTGIGMNEYERVVEFGLYKDRTGEELKGQSTMAGPFAGLASSIWREQSARARDLALRSDPVISPNDLKQEYANNSWAFTNIFSVTQRHDLFYFEALSVMLKLDKVRPFLLRLWGQGPTSVVESGVLCGPKTKEVEDARKACTPDTFKRAGDATVPTDWFENLLNTTPAFSTLSLDFLTKEGFERRPAADFIPPGVVMPPIPPERRAEWEAAFIIRHPNDPIEAAQYQAMAILTWFSHLHNRPADVLYCNIFDVRKPKNLQSALLRAQPGLHIRPVYCDECPQMLYDVAATNTEGEERVLQHDPRKWLPDQQTLEPPRYPDLVKRVSDQLRAHRKGDRHRQGTVGAEYRTFWDLPLMVKQACVHACFFHNATLAKIFVVKNRQYTLLGKVVEVVNWQCPPKR
ncbi:hypothetical protein DL93DRAFT_2161579 [Clavulina sp. PMI_390]|nr:hypothetical protein DL93DRAFT_2161579 [Clavulina sp. PMI_390]